MSDSVRPHKWQPTRLPRPWDSPGKNTGVGCCFLLQCMKVKSESEVAQSCATLSDPMDCSLPGSSVYGIFQARVLEWGAIAFSVGLNSVDLFYVDLFLMFWSFEIFLVSSLSVTLSSLSLFLSPPTLSGISVGFISKTGLEYICSCFHRLRSSHPGTCSLLTGLFCGGADSPGLAGS